MYKSIGKYIFTRMVEFIYTLLAITMKAINEGMSRYNDIAVMKPVAICFEPLFQDPMIGIDDLGCKTLIKIQARLAPNQGRSVVERPLIIPNRLPVAVRHMKTPLQTLMHIRILRSKVTQHEKKH